MKKLSRNLRSQLPCAILIVVIASLCFSVGEGLRLTPFPVSTLTPAEVQNSLLDTEASLETSVYKYGPLNVPTQTQKRGKRQIVDYACSLSGVTRELFAHRFPSSDPESFQVVSILSISRPAGRAPPLAS